MKHDCIKIRTVLLAAGESRRFGGIKQLATVNGQQLISVVLDNYLQQKVAQTFVVLGANAEKISALLPKEMTPLIAPDWQKGLGHSLAFAVSQLPADTSHVLIALADQLAITKSDINRLLKHSGQAPQQIVAAHYAGKAGVPVIFPRSFFPQLCALSGDCGAKKLLQVYADQCTVVDMPRAAIDIDTLEELALYCRESS